MTETLCEICSARPAEMVILRRRGDDAHRSLVCRECGGERARLYANANLDLGGVLARMDIQGSRGRSSNGACERCGMTSAEIAAEGKPGCCLCYIQFHSAVEELIRDAQGHARHVGKAPDR